MSTFDPREEAYRFERTEFLGSAAEWRENLAREFQRIFDAGRKAGPVGAVDLTDPEPVHLWFELSYANYLTVPRSALQSMPQEWQARLVRCLEELDEAIAWRPREGCYWVALKDGRGRIARDPLADYDRGRRRLPLKADGRG